MHEFKDENNNQVQHKSLYADAILWTGPIKCTDGNEPVNRQML